MGTGKTNTSLICAILLLIHRNYNYTMITICTPKAVEKEFIKSI